MTLAVRAVFSVMAYLGVVIAPLVFAAISGSRPALGFWTNFSVALGFVGLAMMGLEFVLVARFDAMAAPFGQDALLQFHRQIGYVGLGFVLAHMALSADWGELLAKLTFSSDTMATPALVVLGSLAALALIALVVSSVWRRQLRLSYEWWHAILLRLLSGAEIIATDLDDRKLATARASGATHTINARDPEVQRKILDLARGVGVSAAFDFVGADSTLTLGPWPRRGPEGESSRWAWPAERRS